MDFKEGIHRRYYFKDVIHRVDVLESFNKSLGKHPRWSGYLKKDACQTHPLNENCTVVFRIFCETFCTVLFRNL